MTPTSSLLPFTLEKYSRTHLHTQETHICAHTHTPQHTQLKHQDLFGITQTHIKIYITEHCSCTHTYSYTICTQAQKKKIRTHTSKDTCTHVAVCLHVQYKILMQYVELHTNSLCTLTQTNPPPTRALLTHTHTHSHVTTQMSCTIWNLESRDERALANIESIYFFPQMNGT